MIGLPSGRCGHLIGSLLLAAAIGACSTTPDPTPAPTNAIPAAADFHLGCIEIEAAECRFVAERIVGSLPEERRAPFNVVIRLFPCENGVACPLTLAARRGQALIEYAGGAQPIHLSLAGPPVDPQVEPMDVQVWTDPILPSSVQVAGDGPFEFEVGHCGLQHIVDFDGSFWVIVDVLRVEVNAMHNSERGIMARNGPNMATYIGTGVPVRLARFPGAKRFFLCD